MTILVTGAAGFIGSYVCQALYARGEKVIGLDNFNDYYDPQLKRDRVKAVCPDVEIFEIDLTDREKIDALLICVVESQVKPLGMRESKQQQSQKSHGRQHASH